MMYNCKRQDVYIQVEYTKQSHVDVTHPSAIQLHSYIVSSHTLTLTEANIKQTRGLINKTLISLIWC